MSSINSDQSSKGVELLSIPGAIATQEYHGDTVVLASGKLQALLVSIELGDDAQQSPTAASSKEKASDYSTDLWLVLSIGDDFSLPVPATQQILPQGDTYKRSYTFPSVELEGASVKISLPATTNVNTITRFQQILAQYAAYHDEDRSDAGAMELMDEDGQVLGVVQGFTVHESDAVSDSGNEKAPVLIDLPPEAASESERQDLEVDVLSADEKRDWMIKGADTISRSIVKTADFVGGKIQGAASSYMARTPAAGSPGTTTPNNEKAEPGRDPVKIGPKTHAGARTLNEWSGHAVQVSAQTTGAILKMAGNIGDKIGRKTGIQRKANPDGTSGPAPKGIRGFVNRSLIAANTVLDGIDAGAQTLLYTSGQAASDVVGHKYGDDARTVAEAFGRTGKNVFIVYKDVRGIRRSALLKAARGRVMKAKLQDGREVTIKVDEKGNAVASSVSQSGASNTSASSEKSSYISASEKQDPNPPAY